MHAVCSDSLIKSQDRRQKMDKSILVNKINMHCPICDNIHDVEERKEIIEIVLHGKK